LPTDESATYAPTESIKAYWEELQESYTIIGRLSAGEDSDEETLFKKLKQKAMAMGAHAIIMGGTSQQSSVVGTPMYGGGTLIVPVSSTREALGTGIHILLDDIFHMKYK
jgi:hypothetical protein